MFLFLAQNLPEILMAAAKAKYMARRESSGVAPRPIALQARASSSHAHAPTRNPLAAVATLPAGSPAAELLTARYTVSRYKAVFGGDLPAGWGMGIVEADDSAWGGLPPSAPHSRPRSPPPPSPAAVVKKKEDAKEKRREDNAAKMAGKKRSREPEE